MTNNRLLLIVILIFFLITRLYNITEVPASLYWDEASIGYNAYSILSDGKDEWGKAWPLHFRAFGEFKLPVYIYTVVIFERLLGVNELAVRLPAVLFSLGVIILTYLISLRIFKNEKLSLLSAFILSISPWFLVFSRTGYEATTGLMFYLLGNYLFLLSFKKFYLIIFTFISFILSMYSYNSFRIIIPLTIIFLIILALQGGLLKSKKYFSIAFFAIIIFFILCVPIARLMSSPDGNSRVQAVGIFNDDLTIKEVTEVFSKNYLSHFTPAFLFSEGDKNLRSHAPGAGQLYILDLLSLFVLVIFSLYFYKKRYLKTAEFRLKGNLLLIALPVFVILIGFIPSAITKEAPHALRSLAVVPFLSMMLASGVVLLGEKTRRLPVYIIIVGIYFASFAFYYNNFIVSYNLKSSADWQFGYEKVFVDFSQEFNKFDQVIVTDEYAQPYVFALFYLHYNPTRFRNEVKYNPVDKRGLSMVASFSNFIFEIPDVNKMPSGRSLVFASPKERLEFLPVKDEIKNLDGSVAFYIYEINK